MVQNPQHDRPCKALFSGIFLDLRRVPPSPPFSLNTPKKPKQRILRPFRLSVLYTKFVQRPAHNRIPGVRVARCKRSSRVLPMILSRDTADA